MSVRRKNSREKTCLACFALVTLGSLAVLPSCHKEPAAAAEAQKGADPSAGGLRVVASEHGFAPASLTLPKGAPGAKATVTFTRTSDQTCATEVVFPDLDIKKDLPLNKPVSVDVPLDPPRTLAFQCGMGMYKGALVVK